MWRLTMTLSGLALVLASCSNQVGIGEAVASGPGTKLDLGLDSCGGSYEVEVIETPDSVTIIATDLRSPISFSGGDCQDGWTVDLDEPLGDRSLFDGSSNRLVVVRFEPWNQGRFSEAEYRQALTDAVTCIEQADPLVGASVIEGPNGPDLDLDLGGDLDDGESRSFEDAFSCIESHVEPLKH